MTPPNKSPEGQHNNQGRNHSGHKGRGRGRGHGKGRGPSNGPKKFFCHFHGSDSDHTTNFCLEKKRTLERMEEDEKKAKLVSHTAWSGPSAPLFPPTPNLYNPTYQPTQHSPTIHTQTTGHLSHQLTPNRYLYLCL